jgi:hypothetical protein
VNPRTIATIQPRHLAWVVVALVAKKICLELIPPKITIFGAIPK